MPVWKGGDIAVRTGDLVHDIVRTLPTVPISIMPVYTYIYIHTSGYCTERILMLQLGEEWNYLLGFVYPFNNSVHVGRYCTGDVSRYGVSRRKWKERMISRSIIIHHLSSSQLQSNHLFVSSNGSLLGCIYFLVMQAAFCCYFYPIRGHLDIESLRTEPPVHLFVQLCFGIVTRL